MKNSAVDTATAAGSGPSAHLARTVTPAEVAAAMPDDDEIVYPVSSRSSEASTSPDFAEDKQTIFCQEHDNEINDSKNNGRGQNNDPFLEDFVLERGDAGSKEWSPAPTVPRARPRGRGHRSTKSEPPMPTPVVPREPKAKLKPVKESWADDLNGLEEQMNRAKLEDTLLRPRSMPGAGADASRGVRSATSTPRKQRSQKKQKGAQRARGASVPSTRSSANNTGANTKTTATPSSPSSESTLSPTKTSIPPGNPGTTKPGSPKKKSKKGGKNKNRPKKEDVAPQLAQSAPSTAPSTPRGLGRRSIVDDISEYGDAVLPPRSLVVQPPPQQQTDADRLLGVAYDEAVKFMNAFIENPDYYTSRASRLTFLQALIVELGLVSASGPERTLPGSLNAAKALLKSHAFLNVKDYLMLREQGLDALQSAMRPSRSALVRDLRGKNGRRAKLNWVKETGLNVLLVSCHY